MMAEAVSQKSTKRFYRHSLARYWLWYPIGFFALFVTNVTEVMTPKFIQWALDTITATKDPVLGASELQRICLWFLLSLTLGALGRLGWRQALARQSHVAGRDLKIGLWEVLRHLPLPIFHRYPLGDLMNRETGDWNASRQIHGFTLVTTFDLLFFSILAISSMLLIHLKMTLYSLLIFLLLPRFLLKLAKKEHEQHRFAQEKLGILSEHIAQALSAIRLSRATGSDQRWERSLGNEAKQYAERRYKVAKTSSQMFPIAALPTLIAYAVLIFLGVSEIQKGELTIGEFMALQSYVLMLQTPLFDLGDIIAEWQRGFASLSRLLEIFSLKRIQEKSLQSENSLNLASSQPFVEVRNLTFSYPDLPACLKNINLKVQLGEIVGIHGPIGAGKTSLLKLLAGLLEANPKEIFLGRNEISQISRSDLTQNVVMVPQNAFLFAGSVRYNLMLDSHFTDEKLWEVLDLMKLSDDIRSFPGQLDAWIGESGVNLSGGQRQRLALARALLRDRSLLLLDDCLSAVDALTSEAILDGMRSYLKNHCAIIWVAHRLSTLRLCDRVYELYEGQLQ